MTRVIDMLEEALVTAVLRLKAGTIEHKTAVSMRDGISEFVRRVEDDSMDNAVNYAISVAAIGRALLTPESVAQFDRNVERQTVGYSKMLETISKRFDEAPSTSAVISP